MKFKYTNADHTQIGGELDPGESLGNMLHPADATGVLVFSIGMAPGNREHDALEELVANDEITIEDYEVAPEPVPVEVSDRQFAQALAEPDGGFKTITWDEAEAWGGGGELPAVLAQGVATIRDPDDAGRTRVFLKTATTFERNHPLVPLIAQLLPGNWNEARLDALWRYAKTL